MKELLAKISLKQKMLFGVIILVIAIIVIVFLTRNSPDKIAKKYGDILVKGNYGNILDITYFPKSEFITKEKIEQAKSNYFEQMKRRNNEITSYTYSVASETDDKVIYKLIFNGKTTQNIEVDKKTNKILMDDLYNTKTIETYAESIVTIDGKEISNPRKENGKEIYEAIVLSNVEYEIKVKPKTGVDDETINKQIEKESEDGSKITLTDRKTDLENKIDTLVFSREYDDGILSIIGSFEIVYKFNDNNTWEYNKKENENYDKKWNISGTWEYMTNNRTINFTLTEKDGELTGIITDVQTGLFKGNYTMTYNTGKLSDGKIEMHGEYRDNNNASEIYGGPKPSDLIGTINSKEKTIAVTVSNYYGNVPTILTKK